MPANKKHLTQSPWQRLAKITAGFVGGYTVTQTLGMVLMLWWDFTNALITLQFGGFILWSVLLILAFLSKSGFKILGIYLLLTALFSLVIYFNHFNN